MPCRFPVLWLELDCSRFLPYNELINLEFYESFRWLWREPGLYQWRKITIPCYLGGIVACVVNADIEYRRDLVP